MYPWRAIQRFTAAPLADAMQGVTTVDCDCTLRIAPIQLFRPRSIAELRQPGLALGFGQHRLTRQSTVI